MINKNEIVLKPLVENDIILLESWLDKEYTIKVLLSNGFQKKHDGDYRKVINCQCIK